MNEKLRREQQKLDKMIKLELENRDDRIDPDHFRNDSESTLPDAFFSSINEDHLTPPQALLKSGDAVLFDTIIHAKDSRYKFKAVTGCLPLQRSGLLKYGNHFLVKPYFASSIKVNIASEIQNELYQLIEIPLIDKYWKTLKAKKELRALEDEFQALTKLRHENILTLYAFEVEKVSISNNKKMTTNISTRLKY